jgi:uncharacterized protein (TIGR03643 family)
MKKNDFDTDTNRLIEMAWQDSVPFDAIEYNYGLSENMVKKTMRKLLTKNSYKRWRARVQGRKIKHASKLDHKPIKFQGPW